MIIGRGDISKAIKDREGFTFFCNGVSNRTPITSDTKAKEIMEISKHIRSGDMFVYISSLSIYYSDNEYNKHKLNCEKLIKKNFTNYCIIRIGNILWGDNPNTLVNHLAKCIFSKQPYEVKNVYRYLITRDEFRHWMDMIPAKGQHEMNITGKMYKIKDIVNAIKEGNL